MTVKSKDVGWKGGSRGKGHMYTYGWFMLLYGRNNPPIGEKKKEQTWLAPGQVVLGGGGGKVGLRGGKVEPTGKSIFQYIHPVFIT